MSMLKFATKEQIISALHYIIDNGPKHKIAGLCYELCMLIPEDTRLNMAEIYLLFESWENFSGFGNFPVPGGIKVYQENHKNGTLWSGEQLSYRISLCKHMLNELQS